MKRIAVGLAMMSIALMNCQAAFAADHEAELAIRNNRFEPAELRVPAGRKVRLVIRNFDAAAEEFESHDLNREKVIAAGASAAIYIGPLSPGRYPFYGEFHESTARGTVIAE